MLKVDYVLFKESLPFTPPRCDERDHISLGRGPDLRYPAISWGLQFDPQTQTLEISCYDKDGPGPVSIVPISNCRVFRLSKEEVSLSAASGQAHIPKIKP